jgi:hypothetical protein
MNAWATLPLLGQPNTLLAQDRHWRRRQARQHRGRQGRQGAAGGAVLARGVRPGGAEPTGDTSRGL